MVIKCGRVTNMGDKCAVVSYGPPPNNNGPSDNGYSVLLSNFESVEPSWTMGQNIIDALVVSTAGHSRLTWKIYNADWKIYVYVASNNGDDALDFRPVGYIAVVVGEDQFFLWIANNRLAISNDVYALASARDGKKYRFFIVTKEDITASDDPATLLDAIE